MDFEVWSFYNVLVTTLALEGIKTIVTNKQHHRLWKMILMYRCWWIRVNACKTKGGPFLKCVVSLYGHCPNSLRPPLPSFVKQAPWSTFFELLFVYLFLTLPKWAKKCKNHPGKRSDSQKNKKLPIWTWKKCSKPSGQAFTPPHMETTHLKKWLPLDSFLRCWSLNTDKFCDSAIKTWCFICWKYIKDLLNVLRGQNLIWTNSVRQPISRWTALANSFQAKLVLRWFAIPSWNQIFKNQ